MMQVENEVGILDHLGKTPGNARRDFSAPANAAYNGPVPGELIKYLSNHKDNLFPELSKVWQNNGNKTSGTWEEVFGKSEFKPNPGGLAVLFLLYRGTFLSLELCQLHSKDSFSRKKGICLANVCKCMA